MEIVALSMAAMCFIFGLIAITRVDQIKIEDQLLKIPLKESWRNRQKFRELHGPASAGRPWGLCKCRL